MEKMNNKLNELLSLPSENEVVEFKEAKENFDFDDLWKYFSALSNEANLHHKKNARLIFGIRNDKTICGTNYRKDINKLNYLKKEIADKTTNRISFIDIHTLETIWWRVILFEIPATPQWIPMAWNWHYYARDHESLTSLNIEKIERIRNQSNNEDRSAKVIDWASIDDLDLEAILQARKEYLMKHQDKKNEIDERDNKTFLNKAKITIKWKITNTAIILLWKEESEHFLSPSIAKISRVLKDRDWYEKDYEHFSCPFILSVTRVYNKIRKTKYRYIANEKLFPEEIDQYDPFIIRESLNNCIAHQNYKLWWKINLIEQEDILVFSNLWSFMPGNIENVIESDSPSEFYRNRFLVEAMENLNMIDTIWSWIKQMFRIQKNRLFPLPDYKIEESKVTVTIIGKVLDLNYARKLLQNTNLSLYDIILLDKVQKKKELSEQEVFYLKKNSLIEWRKPNFYISLWIAQKTDLIWDYVMYQSAIQEQREKVYKLIRWYKDRWISKSDIMKFMIQNNIFEKWLEKNKQEYRLQNILTFLRKENKIKKTPAWYNTIRTSFNF